VRRAAEFVDVPLGEVHVGDAVLVKPGGMLPVDGTVIGEGS
jgi:cation transport ATPase